MKSKISVNDYLSSIFGNRFSLVGNKNSFPLFLKNNFSFHFVRISENGFVLAEPKEQRDFSLVSYRKSKQQIEKAANRRCVLVIHYLGTHLKEGLIRNGFMFIVPGKEIYLPECGILLQKEKKRCQETLTPSSQLGAIYLFYTHISGSFTGSVLKKNLGMNAMTTSRIMRQLVQLGFFNAEKNGRTIAYASTLSRKEYLNLLLEHGMNPVIETIPVDTVPSGTFLSGESAMNHYTFLSAPDHVVFAAYGTKPKESFNADTFSAAEIYKYNPRFLSSVEYADPVSVLLSFKGKSVDERTEAELERLKEEITSENHQWSSELH